MSRLVSLLVLVLAILPAAPAAGQTALVAPRVAGAGPITDPGAAR